MSTKQKGPGGSSHSHQDPNDQKAANDKAQPSARRFARHAEQAALFLTATAYPLGSGLQTITVMIDTECQCGDWHRHTIKPPVPRLLRRRARCGTRYELALHAPRATRRGKRAA
ncbi:hypothetical protein [Streptosporangium amethystogenes]|uniref:hypothetical protein n=1 Tax=Streptosporangium amethystogenes TaxID=2002 RepID=UPI0004CA1DE6|nr:hypothetical protein [Streptosporangium amethystogenes]